MNRVLLTFMPWSEFSRPSKKAKGKIWRDVDKFRPRSTMAMQKKHRYIVVEISRLGVRTLEKTSRIKSNKD